MMSEPDPVMTALERLQQDRNAGRTCVLMAFGPPMSILRASRSWGEQAGREVVTWRAGGQLAALSAIGDVVAQRSEIRRAAMERVLPDGGDAGDATWNMLSEDRRRSLLETACPDGPERAVLRRLLDQDQLTGPSFWTGRRFESLIALGAASHWPLLFAWVEPFEIEAVAWIDGLMETAPSLPILIGTSIDGVETLRKSVRDGRRQAVLLSENVIVVEEPESADPVDGQEGTGATVSERVARMVPNAQEAHAEAVEELKSGRAGTKGPYDSAAEAFLARVLETHPVTANLFSPQGEPGFQMRGGSRARVDFLAATFRIAIEVDGPHHLEVDQYKRDRHKDLELQALGYVVLRFLAEDVVVDFERVRATINRVVLSRARGATEFPV